MKKSSITPRPEFHFELPIVIATLTNQALCYKEN